MWYTPMHNLGLDPMHNLVLAPIHHVWYTIDIVHVVFPVVDAALVFVF